MIGPLFPVVNRIVAHSPRFLPQVLSPLPVRIEAIQSFVDRFPTQKAAADAIGASSSQLSKVLKADSATPGRVESIEGKIALWKVASEQDSSGKAAGPTDTPAPTGSITDLLDDPERQSGNPFAGLSRVGRRIVTECHDEAGVVYAVEVVFHARAEPRQLGLSTRAETAGGPPTTDAPGSA